MSYHLHIPPDKADLLPVRMIEQAIAAVHDIRAELAKQ
jgi:hypothetical protein